MRIRTLVSLTEIAAADWDRCSQWAPPGDTSTDARNPFTAHAFLLALEQSGSVGARAGWTSAHLVAEDETGRVVGVAPNYLKAHSQANTSSTTLGPTPTIAPAGATIRSCNARFRSPRRLAAG